MAELTNIADIVHIQALQKSLGGRSVLNIDSVSLPAGEIVALRGSNGSGKTTLLRILAGLEQPDSCDSLIINGTQYPAVPSPPQVAYMQQIPQLLNRSVRANVAYGVRCCRLPASHVQAAIDWAELNDLADRMPHQLSGGELRRVCLARIWALRPQLYLLDEPDSNLDEAGQERVHQLTMSLRQQSATAIISTHNPLPYATREWILKEGKVLDVADNRQ